MKSSYIRWRGLRIHVAEEGAGLPLVLVNGLGGNTRMWRPFANQFPNRRIICFDAPGTGHSGTPMSPVPVAMLAELVVSVLDHLDIKRADILGYSYGGAVAQQLAHDHPDRVRRLVLAATTCGVGAAMGSMRAWAVLSTTMRYHSAHYFERTAAVAYGGRTGRNPAVRRQMMLSRQKRPPSTYGYTMQLLGASGWSSRHFLHRIEAETLVICGDDDPLVPLANAEMLARHIPNAKLEIVERGGHLLLWDDSENLGQRIRRFIDAKQGAEKWNGNVVSLDAEPTSRRDDPKAARTGYVPSTGLGRPA
jgi:poly(3-hydroxyoctanoate) depolymerase